MLKFENPSTSPIEGWLSDEEAKFLESLVKSVALLSGAFLEAGSWYGRSSVAIGTEVKKLNGTLYCIDLWGRQDKGVDAAISESGIPRPWTKPWRDPYAKFSENIADAGLTETVIPIQGLSADVRAGWTEPLRFIFIDACHEYPYVLSDTLWRRHLVEGGIIAFHDFNWPGVSKALHETFDEDVDYRVFDQVNSLIALKRVK